MTFDNENTFLQMTVNANNYHQHQVIAFVYYIHIYKPLDLTIQFTKPGLCWPIKNTINRKSTCNNKEFVIDT